MASNDPIGTSRSVNPDTGKTVDRDRSKDANPDPITGAPGSHPVGTGIGAAAAGAAGAAIGSVVPGIGNVVGGVVGAVVGAVAGGYAGKGVAEAIDPTAEESYWKNEYRNRKYYDSSLDYDNDLAPAYRYGWESYGQHGTAPFDQRESDLRSGWESRRGKSRLDWDRAQHAVRDAWDRLKDKTAGSSSPDSPTYQGQNVRGDDATSRTRDRNL